jgi:twitching motility protein PilT
MAHDLRRILELAIEHGASDVVLTAGASIAYKIHGRWAQVNVDPLTGDEARALVDAVLGAERTARLDRERELDFSFEFEMPPREAKPAAAAAPPLPEGAIAAVGKGPEPAPPAERRRYRYRGSAFFQRGAPGVVLRLVPREIPTLEQLGLPAAFETFALQPQGLFLVTGPTGHGKTTTLAAMVDAVNRNRRCHVVTIEDPIEYVHRSRLAVIEQREVGSDTPSFASALRHVLRQAPDVILIGEMRDQETFQAALTAAETGHMVLATLHTNDCVKTIDRIVDSFSPYQQNQVRAQLALALTAIVSQRLIPMQDGKGRVAALELLINNAAIGHLIREQKIYQIYSVIETSSKEGMLTMDASIVKLYQTGKISLAEAKLRLKNPALLEGPARPAEATPPAATRPGKRP